VADTRALALKLIGVDGTPLLSSVAPGQVLTQDFISVNEPTFFLHNMASAMSFFPGLLTGTPFDGLDALEKASAAASMRVIDDVFGERYWSQVPYRFGAGTAAKFSIRPLPCATPPAIVGDHADPDYLRKAAATRLAAANACFVFSIQLQRDPVAQPVEDAVKLWDEAEAPFVDLAIITVPSGQDPTEPGRQAFCENLSFSPWNGIQAHKPLGAAGRLRQAAYSGISAKRRIENGVARSEPTGTESFFAVIHAVAPRTR
jgi:hypothetical protein